ncbi:MAG: hypothetical protein JO122_19385 [Acetobacteraceae bacterium]|nr:hypothetical protein [Acetobacteraceae bacterium]
MSEGGQAVIEQRADAGESQGAGDVDDVNVGEFLGQAFELQVGVAEPVAMAMWPAVSEAQRLEGGFGQGVEQDGGGGDGPQVGHQAPRGVGVNEGGVVVVVTRLAEGDRVAGLKRADDDGVVGSVLGEGGVGGEGRSDPEVDPAGGGFLAEEVGFHLHVTVAEQEDVDAAAELGGRAHVARSFDGPVRL